MSKNLSHLSGRKGLEFNLFEQLGILSEATGTPSIEELEKLKDTFLFGTANLYGSVTFYDFLKPENQGKKVYVCNGTACMCAGTQDVVKEKLLNYFQENEIGDMCCLGRCHENYAFHLNGENFSGLSGLDAIEETENIKPGSGKDHYTVLGSANALLIHADESSTFCKEYIHRLYSMTPEQVLAEIMESGLRGRGGAGFPIGIKLDSCKKTDADVKFIVCNADEGDPGAYSDRYLMEYKPLTLLLGMITAGYVTGASWGVLYIRAEYPESVHCISEAIEKLKSWNIAGTAPDQNTFSFQFKVIKAQGAYICGEETALLSSIEGQRPEVRVRPPYPAQSGLFQKPTVVNNVETLAALPNIIMKGGKSYASLGRGKSTGTKLLSLDSYFNRPGIYEVEMGYPLSSVIEELGKGFRENIKAIHIGGPLGGVVPVHKIGDLTVDFESFQQNGFLLGHGSFVCIPESFAMIDYIRHLFHFTAHESCGKCFPCRLGSTRGYEMIDKALGEDYKLNRELLQDLLETMETGSLCALGGGLPLPVKNIIMYFEQELSEYFA
jgi:NADH-quinone oxidoreductase subunit F